MGTSNIISVAIFGASMPHSLTEFLEYSCSKFLDVYSSVIGSVFSTYGQWSSFAGQNVGSVPASVHLSWGHIEVLKGSIF